MIHVLIGTKAQLIKMAPIMRTLLDRGVKYNFIHTGQHHETISDILSDFELPDVDFYIKKNEDITRKTQIPNWLRLCEKETRKDSLCWKKRTGAKHVVLVHGDTLSTLVGALAAKRAGIPCAHIESGLSSRNIFHPFPEELIRLSTFRLADILFCPDEIATQNVKDLKKKIINTSGNTMIDATRYAVMRAESKSSLEYGIVSLHRYENIFNMKRLFWLIDKVIEISQKNKLIFVMHPPTEERLKKSGLYDRIEKEKNIIITPRMGYVRFVGLLSSARFLITDGGSNQEECSYLGVPCLIMRKATERSEGLENNAMLANYDNNRILNFLDNLDLFRKKSSFPDSSPSEIIADYLTPFYEH